MSEPTESDVTDRVAAGLAAQRAVLSERIDAGARQVGWKIGFGSPSGLALLHLDAPLMGHLLDSGELSEPASAAIDDWTGPVIEAEIAAWIGADVPSEVSAASVHEYLGGLGAAIELADLDHAPADPERILAGNIFQRSFLLGSPDPDLTIEQVSGLRARFTHNDETIEVAEPCALTGDLRVVLAHAARTAPLLGRGLQAGDVILLGSIIVPRKVAPGDVCTYILGDYPGLTVTFT